MTARHQILVEGVNDQHLIRNLLLKHRIICTLIQHEPFSGDEQFVIRRADGYENLLRTLHARLAEDGLERLAVVVDADLDIATRWRSLSNRLIDLGATGLPAEPLAEGTSISVQLPDRSVQVSLWLMPDNALPGRLETFAGLVMGNGDVLWPHAKQVVEALPEKRFLPAAREKVDMATWLAWQQTPGMRLGEAVSASLLDAHAAHAQRLVNWIKHVFELA